MLTVNSTLTVADSATLQGAATGTIKLPGNAQMLYTSNANSTFGGQINTDSLDLGGSLTLAPTAANVVLTLGGSLSTYAGPTSVYGGTLRLAPNGGIDCGALQLFGYGVFDMDGGPATVRASLGPPAP